MSLGNLRDNGNKGTNYPYQLRNLQLLADIVSTGNISTGLLTQILAAIQAGSDYEAALVVDNAGVTWLEVRVWNPSTGTFDPPIYYLAGTTTTGTPAAPITYINPNTYLSQIVSNTTGLALETTLSTMNSKFVNGTDIGDVTINNGAGASAVNVQDGGNVISVDDAGSSLTVDDGGVALATYPLPATPISGYVSNIAVATPQVIISAPGSGQYVYLTQLLVTNASSSVATVVSIQDNIAGILYTGYAASAGGGFSVTFPTPLKCGTGNLEVVCGTTGSSIYVSVNGFVQ